MTSESAARQEILRRVRASLGLPADGDAGTRHMEIRFPEAQAAAQTVSGAVDRLPRFSWPERRSPRSPTPERDLVESELSLLLDEIVQVGGHVRRLEGEVDLLASLKELVDAEQVARAALWQTVQLCSLGLAETLASIGVKVLPPGATPAQIAECDLGITGVDGALAETGTLLLRSGPERPRTVSLLPRVHLALLTPGALRADLGEALAECWGAACTTLITGPSRTSDIELTLTIGVHGPKALHVWVLYIG